MVLFIPVLSGFTGPEYKLLVSFLMVMVVFAPRPPRQVMVLLAYFYLSTFALGGTVMGIIYFMQRNMAGDRLAGLMHAVDAYLWYGILLALLVFGLGGRLVPAALKKRLLMPLLRSDLVITLRCNKTCLAALLDTGNSLTDPLSGHPVVIAEYEALKEILSDEVRRAVDLHGLDDAGMLLAEMGESIKYGNFRLIPYRSVGREDGWMVGFRPDSVLVRQGGNSFQTGDVIVALCPDRIQGDTPCRALLPPELLETTLVG